MDNKEIKRILEETGWRKAWLAGLLFVHPSLVSKWLAGERDAEKYMGRIRKIFDLYKKGEIMDPKAQAIRGAYKVISVSESSHAVAKKYCASHQMIVGAWVGEIIKKSASGLLIDISKLDESTRQTILRLANVTVNSSGLNNG